MSYWLLVIGYWLLVIGYWLLVIGYWLLVIGYSGSHKDSRTLLGLGPLGLSGYISCQLYLIFLRKAILVISHQEEGRIVGDRTPSSLHIIFPRTTTIKLVRSEDFSPHKN
ncbi:MULTISPECIES: hypothetical protein [unclassified Microcoleus]|uniref:hypothetical protein n=1 Tax=unclassified Microcoleus TaxID=2642155 RepID=UPI0025EBFEDE|nr:MULTISPECIES: hypothetical protein [unclassified Microcoleus]